MRTKSLLLMAAVAAAGVVGSSAQVYSVNIVGYVQTTLQGNGKFTPIANPLNAPTNTIDVLLADVPTTTQIFKFNTGTGQFAPINRTPFGFNPPGQTLAPGEGAFVLMPVGSANLTITFVGDVMTGTVTNSLVTGFNFVASKIPQQDSLVNLGLTGSSGDQVFKFDTASQTYTQTPVWNPILQNWGSTGVTVGVGESFFISKVSPSSWVRTFTP